MALQPLEKSLKEKYSAFGPHARTVFEEFCVLNAGLINPYRAVTRAIHFNGIGKGVEEDREGDGSDGRERDGEHAFHVGFVGQYFNRRYRLDMNDLRILDYANCHDMPEVFAGETPAFQPYDSKGRKIPCHVRGDKKLREAEAIARIAHSFGTIVPWVVETLFAYEAQADEESRFVYALDKFVACANVFQDKGRTNQRYHIVLEETLKYKLPKVKRHPFVHLLFLELEKEMRAHPEYFWNEAKAAE